MVKLSYFSRKKNSVISLLYHCYIIYHITVSSRLDLRTFFYEKIAMCDGERCSSVVAGIGHQVGDELEGIVEGVRRYEWVPSGYVKIAIENSHL